MLWQVLLASLHECPAFLPGFQDMMISPGASRLDRFLTYSAGAAVLSAFVAIFASSSTSPADYQRGDKFASVPGFEPSRASGSIVVFLNTNCAACQSSAVVFQRLAQRPRSFQVIVVGYEDEILLKQFVDSSAIAADAVVSMPIGMLRFAAVPRLAVLDHRGVIRAVWAGFRDISESEAAILAEARTPGQGGRP